MKKLEPLETSKDYVEDKAPLLPTTTPVKVTKESSGTIAEFIFAFLGLMISYVTWGVMQELIMNTKFSPSPLVPSGMFPSGKCCYMRL